MKKKLIDFVCDDCGHEFTEKAEDLRTEGVCNFGDEGCSCCGFVYYTECPKCNNPLEEDGE